jgi:hypothetical protein
LNWKTAKKAAMSIDRDLIINQLQEKLKSWKVNTARNKNKNRFESHGIKI